MHRKKNRITNPQAKGGIIQRGSCPGCGRAVQFYYGENIGQACPSYRRDAESERAGEIKEEQGRRGRTHRGG